MSGLPTYVIVCNGDGCDKRFIWAGEPRLGRLRQLAAVDGWTHVLSPLPNHSGPAPIHDYCPGHSKGEKR